MILGPIRNQLKLGAAIFWGRLILEDLRYANERRQEVDLCTKKIYVVCYVKSQTQQAATSLGSACRKANLWRQLGAVNTARRCDRRRRACAA